MCRRLCTLGADFVWDVVADQAMIDGQLSVVARPHIQNWIDCVKTRSEPNAPVEFGHRSATICHLAGIARQLGRKLNWDPNREIFPDDEEANSLLDRPRRSGWELPEIG